MNEQQIIEEYYCLLFLEDKGELDKFLKNLQSNHDDTREECTGSYILCAFCWKETNEGHKFWYELSSEFNQLPRATMPEEYEVFVSSQGLKRIRKRNFGLLWFSEKEKIEGYNHKITIRIEE